MTITFKEPRQIESSRTKARGASPQAVGREVSLGSRHSLPSDVTWNHPADIAQRKLQEVAGNRFAARHAPPLQAQVNQRSRQQVVQRSEDGKKFVKMATRMYKMAVPQKEVADKFGSLLDWALFQPEGELAVNPDGADLLAMVNLVTEITNTAYNEWAQAPTPAAKGQLRDAVLGGMNDLNRRIEALAPALRDNDPALAHALLKPLAEIRSSFFGGPNMEEAGQFGENLLGIVFPANDQVE